MWSSNIEWHQKYLKMIALWIWMAFRTQIKSIKRMEEFSPRVTLLFLYRSKKTVCIMHLNKKYMCSHKIILLLVINTDNRRKKVQHQICMGMKIKGFMKWDRPEMGCERAGEGPLKLQQMQISTEVSSTQIYSPRFAFLQVGIRNI